MCFGYSRLLIFAVCFFFKQKTAYEMRISDWSSDVCSSDLAVFQVTNAQPGTNVTIVHNTGNTATPGNCSKGLGFPTVCTTGGTKYQYGANSVLTKLRDRKSVV